MSDARIKFPLEERDIPTHWVNLVADLPGEAPPPLHPSPSRLDAALAGLPEAPALT